MSNKEKNSIRGWIVFVLSVSVLLFQFIIGAREVFSPAELRGLKLILYNAGGAMVSISVGMVIYVIILRRFRPQTLDQIWIGIGVLTVVTIVFRVYLSGSNLQNVVYQCERLFFLGTGLIFLVSACRKLLTKQGG